MPVTFELSYHVPVDQVCTYYVVESQCTPSSGHPGYIYLYIYSSAAQRSAVPCLALHFCGAVSCGAVRSFEHSAYNSSSRCDTGTRYRYVRVVYSYFCSLQLIVLSRSPCPSPPRKYHTYCRSERDINKHTAQRRSISNAQASLGSINSLFAPNNHGPLLPAPFTCFSRILPCASVAGGISRPRSGALCFL